MVSSVQRSTTVDDGDPVQVQARERIVIQASRGWAALQMRAVWEYRELLFFLAWRDLTVRYKQTILGVAWAVLQPVVTMVVFTLIFGRLARIPSHGIPYPVFSFCGLLPWNFFASAFGRSSGSLLGNAHLLTKVYFPRLVIPISSLLVGAADFCIAMVVLGGLMLWYGIVPTTAVLWLPGFLVMGAAAALGLGLWLGALNVQYRDVNYVVPLIAQLWMYLTPVVYPSSLVPPAWRAWYALNPMASVVEGFRWALLGSPAVPASMLLASATVAGLLLVSGAYYFRRMERTFADVV